MSSETSWRKLLVRLPSRSLRSSSLFAWFAHPNHQMWISEHVSGSAAKWMSVCGLSISPRCWVTIGWSHQPLSQLCNLATSFSLYNWVLLQSIWRADKWQFEMCPWPQSHFNQKPKALNDHFRTFSWREHAVECRASVPTIPHWAWGRSNHFPMALMAGSGVGVGTWQSDVSRLRKLNPLDWGVSFSSPCTSVCVLASHISHGTITSSQVKSQKRECVVTATVLEILLQRLLFPQMAKAVNVSVYA